jgi:hypothetical protein
VAETPDRRFEEARRHFAGAVEMHPHFMVGVAVEAHAAVAVVATGAAERHRQRGGSAL